MAYGGYSYIEKTYKPDKDDFVVLFWAKGSVDIDKIAEALAAESSVGTWTKLATMNEYIWKRLRARVFRIDKITRSSGFIWLAYPLEHFDVKNLLQFQASVLGNVFGLKELTELVALDVKLPAAFQKNFHGPRAGIEGIRKVVGTEKTRRPHLGTIVKPKVGLAPKEFAQVAYNAYLGGCDFVKDDENLVNQEFCKFEARVYAMLATVDKIKSESGRQVLYSPNITDRLSEMLERVDLLKSAGARMAMIDVFIMGYSALQDIVTELQREGLLIHAHRAGYAVEARGKFGVHYQIHEKFYRLIGVDQLHVGTGVGKMEGGPLLIKRLREVATEHRLNEKLHLGSLAFEWNKNIKPVMPVASGGVNTGMVDALIALHGHDVVVQAGGGMHGHPGGTIAGARAMRQAIAAAMRKIPLPKFAETHLDLARALSKWDYVKPDSVKKVLAQENRNIKTLRKRTLSKGYSFIEETEG
jgi:ribulose-bisphosphate carboxylase large chain